ncbi:Peptide-N4-(N-acetyl-beta-glucosaminyl)asparagine amidase A [Mycena venus]|uniref:Peptide-N4-(N-acetyl-beta-glucosaminyl)asparagine amidase A n=1 Tax=Mycena venus TaxID=2733690 RepID=A0A8H6U1Q1_9AGAR|nr:Peptide-N4-(N-acetyl-beta-glucosaminyl)asparagine amidase A [Mycena venus]
MHNLWSYVICALLFAAVSPRGAAVLVDFQVAQPPAVPQHAKQCTVKILQRDFAFSFGLYVFRFFSFKKPDSMDEPRAEVVQYRPPTDCGTPGTWAAVTLNFAVTSNGTQFDRLAIFTFQTVESSLAEMLPVILHFFAKPGTFILQLDNLIQGDFNGIYSTTLHATFYASSRENPPAKQANMIIPLSNLANNTGNDGSVPPAFSPYKRDPTTKRGRKYLSTLLRERADVLNKLYPSGNGNEVFKYCQSAGRLKTCVAQQGPFREVRLLVDVAGVAFPYPVIFTGGINPACWRPIAAYGALDLPTYFLGSYYCTEKRICFPSTLYLRKLTRSSCKTADHRKNHFVQCGGLRADPHDGRRQREWRHYYSITVTASRKIHIAAEIRSGSGKKNRVVFSQELEYVNRQAYSDNFLVQNYFQSSSGSVLSTHNNVPAVSDAFSYPITIEVTSNDAGTSSSTFIDHSYDRTLRPSPFILGSTIKERQVAGGFFTVDPATNIGRGNGTNNNTHVPLSHCVV